MKKRVNLTLSVVWSILIILTVTSSSKDLPSNQAKIGSNSTETISEPKAEDLKPGHTFNAYKGGKICTQAKDMKYEFT